MSAAEENYQDQLIIAKSLCLLQDIIKENGGTSNGYISKENEERLPDLVKHEMAKLILLEERLKR